MATNADIVRRYLETMVPGTDRLDEVRTLLADDLEFIDPMMQVADADDLIAQVRRFGSGGDTVVRNRIRHVIAEGDVVAALSEFPGPGGTTLTYAQWFWMRDGRIARIRVVYDPRPFLQQ